MSFINHDYKAHRENVLYERERSLLPSTQPAVAAAYKRLEMAIERDTMLQRIQEHKKAIKKLCADMDALDVRIRNAAINSRNTRNNPYRSTVIRGCPKTDCRGFIQKDWKCGICSVSICSKCHEVLPPGSVVSQPTEENPTSLADANDHVCLPGNIETAKMILSQTRPCPKCSVPIYKIDGCDQMFCTQCHTAFSWRSGEIVLKHIHNPHYYEWQRNQTNAAPPREPGDIPCGGIPALYDIRRWFHITDDMIRAHGPRYNRRPVPPSPETSAIPPITPLYHAFCNLHRLVTHIEHVELPNHREPEQQLERNEDIRIQFLMNNLTEDQLKFELQKREKKIQKKRALYLIYDMFLNTVADLLRNALGTSYTNDEANRLNDQLHNLRIYFNDQAKIISRQFNSRVPNISEGWNIYSTDYKR